MANDIKHFGVLGMKWGKRKVHPTTQRINDRANAVLNNPKSSKKEVEKALESIGVDSKSGRLVKTKAVYDRKTGQDVSVNPMRRIGKEKGQSDRDFDKLYEAERKDFEKAVKAENRAKAKAFLKSAAQNKAASEQLASKDYAFRQMRWVDQKLGGSQYSSPKAIVARNLVGQVIVAGVTIALLNKFMK